MNTKIDTSGGCKIETFIAVENYTAAVSVAEKLVEMLDQKGDVIILEGKAGAQSSVDIVAGANDTFAKYPDVNVVASQTASWNRTEAYNVTFWRPTPALRRFLRPTTRWPWARWKRCPRRANPVRF